MPGTFGERLRRQREDHKIDLAAIAEQTKIKRALLEALERDDLSQWPSGIFRRAWIRTYASAIGLNPDEAVQDYLAAHPDPEAAVGEAQALLPPAPAPRFRGLVDAALGSLRLHRRPETPPAFGQATTPAPAAPVDLAPDLEVLARVCTELGRVDTAREVTPLLEDAARLLGASGMIVWVWDHRIEALRPALVHGYAADVVARLPPVKRDSHNATAAAYRSGQARLIAGGGDTSAGLVVPLMIPPRCAGVLAVELPAGVAPGESMSAVATILAASLAQLVVRARAAQVQARLEANRRAGFPADVLSATPQTDASSH